MNKTLVVSQSEMNTQEGSLGSKQQHVTPLNCTLRRSLQQQTRGTTELGDRSSIAMYMEPEGRKKENSENKKPGRFHNENYKLSVSRI